MKKNLVYLSFLLGGMSLVMSGCAPELARTNYGPKEQQWGKYVQGCYDTWAPPPPPAPYSENSTTTSAVSTIESAPEVTAETNIPVAATDPLVTTTEIPVVTAAPAPAPANNTIDAAKPPVSIPSTTYTVKKGESLWLISQKIYGDGKYWKKILEANKSKLPSSGSVKEGMVLTIPAK